MVLFNKKIFFLSISGIISILFFTHFVSATTGGIDPGNYTSYLCSNAACTTGSRIVWVTPLSGSSVFVSDTQLAGYIWGENVGWINLNCDASGGVNCGNSGHFRVSNNGNGVLSGYAWGENTGWINFNCDANGGTNCGISDHFKVTINTSNGEFFGYAWSENFGWIKFDCASGANYCVKTDWRPRAVPPGGGSIGGSTGGGDDINPNDAVPSDSNYVDNGSGSGDNGLGNNSGSSGGNSNDTGNGTGNGAGTDNGNETGTESSVVGGTEQEGNSEILSFFYEPVLGFLGKYFNSDQLLKINLGLKITTIITAFLAGAVSISGLLFLNPITGSELILIPFRLWSLFLTALGLKKKAKPWGTVYDSVTKQPLDPVYVSLINLEGEEIASSITDIDGRYGFYAESGVYKVVPRKTNYIFPSSALANKFQDEFYQDLYFGDYINVAEGQIITNNIPMDPINFDWNEFAKNKKQLFKFYSKRELLIARISNTLFGIGFSISALALILFPERYNIIIFILYILIFILKRTKFKLRAKGRVVDSDGTPLSYALIRVFSVNTNVEMIHRVIDKMGRYYILLPNGRYYAKIEKKNTDGSYSVVHTSEPFEITHGTLNKVFNI
jgi:hypothetical protein